MVQTIEYASRWFIPALVALGLVPSVGKAAHHVDHQRLLPAVHALHQTFFRFEHLACQRPFPKH